MREETRQVARRVVFAHFYDEVNAEFGSRTRAGTPAFNVPRRNRRRIARRRAKTYLRERRGV